MTKPIAILKKNASEELRVSLDRFNGHDLISLRVFYTAEHGERRPGKQGLALRIEMLPALRAAILEAEAEARNRKLIKGGSK